MSIVFEVDPDPREGGVAYDTEISDEYPKSHLPDKSKFEGWNDNDKLGFVGSLRSMFAPILWVGEGLAPPALYRKEIFFMLANTHHPYDAFISPL